MSIEKPKTYVAIILDRSGSMATTKKSAIIGFNEKIQQLKEDAENQDILCSFVTFNAEVFEHLWNVPAKQLAEANEKDYIPLGGTSMLDAIGYTIQKLLDTTDYNDPNISYLIQVISDGETRDDKHYIEGSLEALTESVQATNKWTLNFVGCTAESMKKIARRTSTPIANMAAWSNTSDKSTEQGFANMRARQKKYFDERLMGQIKAVNYACDSNNVADFTAPVQESEPTPIAFDPECFCPRRDVVMPNYSKKSSVEYTGGGIFANTTKVEWEKPDNSIESSALRNQNFVIKK